MGKLLLAALAATTSVLSVGTADARPRWTETRAKAWYASQPWLVGANYTPASAINQLEMWQAATWDPKRIDHELGLDRKSTRLNSSHNGQSRMPSSA